MTPYGDSKCFETCPPGLSVDKNAKGTGCFFCPGKFIPHSSCPSQEHPHAAHAHTLNMYEECSLCMRACGTMQLQRDQQGTISHTLVCIGTYNFENGPCGIIHRIEVDKNGIIVRWMIPIHHGQTRSGQCDPTTASGNADIDCRDGAARIALSDCKFNCIEGRIYAGTQSKSVDGKGCMIHAKSMRMRLVFIFPSLAHLLPFSPSPPFSSPFSFSPPPPHLPP